MEIGDFAYLILLGIFWVFNALRQRKQKQEAELEEQREAEEAAERQAKRGAQPAGERRMPPPEDPVKRVLEELFGQPEADTTTTTPPLQPLPQPKPLNRPVNRETSPGKRPTPQQAWEDAKNADGRRRASAETDAANADGRSRAGSRTDSSNADGRNRAGSRTDSSNSDGRQRAGSSTEGRGSAQTRKPARAKVAEGYIEGESVADYANRTRAASRKKLLPTDGTQGAIRRKTGSAVRFDLRQAVINDAILRRPYK